MNEQEFSIFPEKRIVYGSFWERFAAMFIDGLILLVPNLLIGKFIGGDKIINEIINHDIASASILGQSLQILVGLLYFAVMEAGTSQATFGKRALGLKVTNIAGERISFLNAVGRNAGKWVSDIIIFIGYFMMLWDDKNQTLHDKMAGTLVVKNNPVPNP